MKDLYHKRYLTLIEVTDRNTIYTFRLNVKHRLSEVFDILPSNAIINKGRCGIGGTYLEIEAQRNSIIIVPTNAIIDDKCFVNGDLKPNYFVVRGSFTKKDFIALKEFIESPAIGKKIFSTPEGLRKIVHCGALVANIYSNWFLLFDESHTPITDNYRKGILEAFQFFFHFDNKALISATPYRFSDSRFKLFDIYNIKFRGINKMIRGFIGKIKIINTNNVMTLLHSYLINDISYPGRVHIFLNSVTEIAKAIRVSGIKDYSIFCKDDIKNTKKLDELRCRMKDAPNELTYSMFNFYTSKYFEGWDLKDENATIIIVSDINTLTLKSGVSNKCVQAAGRNRLISHQIVHITNSRNVHEFKTIDELENGLALTADSTINKYNEHLLESKERNFVCNNRFKDLAFEFADIDKLTNKAVLNTYKIDQIVNQEFSNQQFNHFDYIIKAWKEAYYKTTSVNAYVPALPTNISKLNQINRVKAVVECLDEILTKSSIDSSLYLNLLKTFPIDTKEITDAYHEIGGEQMKKLGYNLKFIKKAVIESKNESAEEFIKRDYLTKMGTGEHLIVNITPILQALYIKYNYLNSRTEKHKIATAADLKNYFPNAKQFRRGKINGYRIELQK
jgi:hypothetical protein